MIMQKISSAGLVADFFHDGTHRPRKSVLMLGGSEGGCRWSQVTPVIEQLDQRGYNVLCLAYFREPGLPPSLEQIPLEYFGESFRWLDHHPAVLPGGYALIGGSKGAELALLLASRFPQVSAVIAFSPSHVVWQGIPRNRFQYGRQPVSSWSHGGRDVPFLPCPIYPSDWLALATMRMEGVMSRALAELGDYPQAIIPVERAACPIMLISAVNDGLWPSTVMAEQVIGRLEADGRGYPHQHIAVDANHATLISNRPAWRQAFQFLERHFHATPIHAHA